MKKIKFYQLCAIVVLALSFSSSANSQQTDPATVVFTEKDREFALKYLNETKADYLAQLNGLSDKQLNFRAAEGRWTIAEIAEHITVVEESLYGMVTGNVLRSTPPKCTDVFRMADSTIVMAITNRTQKFTAPEAVRPNGRWKTREALTASFEKTRGTTIDFIKTNKIDLRNLFSQSPVGMIDAYQWLIFINAHSERHLAQLKEVKADKKYPKK